MDEQTIMQVDVVQNFINKEIELANKISEISLPIYQEQMKFFENISYGVAEAISSLAKLRSVSENLYSRTLGLETYKILESFYELSKSLTKTLNLDALYVNNVSFSEDEEEIASEDVKLANEKMITEILLPGNRVAIDTERSAIIKVSPINDNILQYFKDNPKEMYNLSSGDFEEIMAKIYSKLGYDVERTKATRDGGKDLIIRKNELIGDFVYYVECKKYASDRPIGVGIVRDLVGTINTDRVNGGIIATTSFFSADAIKFINTRDYTYQVQMHDYEYIQSLLRKVV